MDIGLTEEQELVRNSARAFLEEECTPDHVRAMESDEKGYSPELWQKLNELGWHGLMIPEDQGGSGMSFYDLCIVVEEIGRSLLPSPFVPTQAIARLLVEAGSAEQKAKYLPSIANGSQIHTYAVTEKSGRWGPDDVKLQATAEGDNVLLDGTKRFVPYAGAADVIWVIARLGETLVAAPVPGKANGVQISNVATMTGEKLAEVALKKVRVPTGDLVSLADFEVFSNPATVLECAYLVGLSRRDFEITVDYAKTREAFGKPIGAFQAIQHKAADMVSDVDGMGFITYRAAAAITDSDPTATMKASMAKAWCSEASRRVVGHGQQIHGAIAFTKEYPLQLYFRRQKHGELFWGDAEFHRDRVEQMLAF